MKNVEGILFDFGSVLGRPISRRSYNVGDIKQVFSKHGIDYTDEQMRHHIKDGLKKYNEFRKTTDLDLPAFDILKLMFPYEFTYKLEGASEDLIYKIDVNKDNVTVRRNAYNVLKELKRRGYKLGLISNTISRHVREEMAKNKLSEFMETEVYSHEALVRKPNKKIFEMALEKIKLLPNKCVYIGDSIEKDVDGAINTGFSRAILYDNYGNKKSNRKYTVIRDLDELLDIFQRCST